MTYGSGWEVGGDQVASSARTDRDADRARLKNIPRSVYTVPFLLSVHPYFDAPGLVEAREIADGHLADCMNMLAFTTG